MKKIYSLLFFCFSIAIFSQNINKTLPNFDRTGMETSVLYTGTSVSNILNYKDNTNNVYAFYQAYKALYFSDFEQRFAPLDNLKAKAKQFNLSNTIPIAVLVSEFEMFNALAENTITKNSNGDIERTITNAPIFDKHQLIMATPLKVKHKGLNPIFTFQAEDIFNTTTKTISNLLVNFDDGNGFIPLQANSSVSVAYAEAGEKQLEFQFNLSDGTTEIVKSKITINYSNQDLNERNNSAITTFTSTNTNAPLLTPYGEANHKGMGEYDIYLSDDNVLDKPIFVIDGFDPADGRNIPSIYSLLDFNNGENLGDLVRAEGFDIVVLNFPVYTRAADNVEVDGGADFIERNAMLLVELIGIINAQKTPGVDQNVVIGPSMGGLISRYALNFMEREGLDHDTRLWISFDSPHNGANVPIGFQYLFNKLAYGLQLGGLAGDQSIEAVQPLVDGMLKSPAARQMLVDQFEAHITSGTDFDSSLMLPQKHGWSDLFYNALEQDFTTSGFPETTRNVSIINGSGIGSTYPDVNGAAILPDFQSLDLQDLSVLDLGFFASADVNITSRFTPYLGQANTVGTIEVVSGGLCFCGFNASATVQAESFSDGVDAGSGGLFDIAGLAADFAGDPLIDSFLAAMKTDSFNFIPTVSAMALENDGEIDWFHVPNNLATSRTVENTTPFEAWHMPDNNEPHVTLTQPNVDFALAEILQNTLSTPSILSDEIKLEQNPVSNNLTLLSTKQFDQTEISIIDITGKTVYSNTTTLQERTNIPLNLASGLYILNINTQENYSLKTKVIIK